MVGPPFNVGVEWRPCRIRMRVPYPFIERIICRTQKGLRMVHEVLISPQFQMSVLLFVALAGYIVASRIGQSAVIGEILVGIIVGPSLFGIVTYTGFVHEIANLGAIILLFVIGLEFNLKDILKPRYFIIALIGVIVPWIMGYALLEIMGLWCRGVDIRRYRAHGDEYRDNRERAKGNGTARDGGRAGYHRSGGDRRRSRPDRPLGYG